MNFSCLRTLKESLDAREVVSQDGPHIAYLTSAGSNSIPGHRLAFPASVVLVVIVVWFCLPTPWGLSNIAVVKSHAVVSWVFTVKEAA